MGAGALCVLDRDWEENPSRCFFFHEKRNKLISKTKFKGIFSHCREIEVVEQHDRPFPTRSCESQTQLYFLFGDGAMGVKETRVGKPLTIERVLHFEDCRIELNLVLDFLLLCPVV